MEHIDRYLALIRELAGRALDMAVDASPTQPRRGERVLSMMQGVPAARRLLEQPSDPAQTSAELSDALSDPAARFTDGLGHHRPIYRVILADQFSRVTEANVPLPELDSPEVHERLWHKAYNMRHGVGVVEFDPSRSEGPIHPQTLEDAPEDWTYRDLAALHALFHVALLRPEQGAWLRRVQSAVLYHLDHTQPDYTTYQPWGLGAFAWFPETMPFADQQIHDVTAHLSIQGAAGALLPGLLLADAFSQLKQAKSLGV